MEAKVTVKTESECQAEHILNVQYREMKRLQGALAEASGQEMAETLVSPPQLSEMTQLIRHFQNDTLMPEERESDEKENRRRRTC